MAAKAARGKALRHKIGKRVGKIARAAYAVSPFPAVETLLGAMANPDEGIRFVLGIKGKGRARVSEVQSVIFDKLKWTAAEAARWLKEHGFATPKVDEAATFWRFRQQTPGKFKEFRTIVPGARNPRPQYQSEAYRAGRSAMRVAASKYGTVNLTPSIAEREEWGHSWSEFMRGWNDEKKAKVNPDVAGAVASYSEHLGMTASPEFQAASPGEQAAAMTAMDLCENPAVHASLTPQEWAEIWNRGYAYEFLNYNDALNNAPRLFTHVPWVIVSLQSTYRYGEPGYGVAAQEVVDRRLRLRSAPNPASGLGTREGFERCVEAVTAGGYADDPEAVCAAAGRRKYGKQRFQEMALRGRMGNPDWTVERGSRVVRVWGDGRAFHSRLYLNRGETASLTSAKHKTLAGAQHWADKVLGGKGVMTRVNPEPEAAQLYEDFHGRPPSETKEIVYDREEPDWLTQLGTLRELKVATVTNLDAAIKFSGKDAPDLCSSEDRRQLYIEGGNQEVDLDALKMGGDSWRKDSMVLGVLYEVTYETEKGFHKFQPTQYYHKLGEGGGEQPVLLYDPNNKLLSVSGGQYQVKAEGIVN